MTYPRSQTPDGVNAEMLDALHQLECQRSEPPKLVLPEKYAGNRELYRGFVNQLSVLFVNCSHRCTQVTIIFFTWLGVDRWRFQHSLLQAFDVIQQWRMRKLTDNSLLNVKSNLSPKFHSSPFAKLDVPICLFCGNKYDKAQYKPRIILGRTEGNRVRYCHSCNNHFDNTWLSQRTGCGCEKCKLFAFAYQDVTSIDLYGLWHVAGNTRIERHHI
ncbi:hypothetical protein MP228_010853 [Amoeboaphelidium protococcarum]|nr:hypothetical protein MP228_010853 [Amoeboaphelidium protococcarum]